MEDAGGRSVFVGGGALGQSLLPIPITISGPTPWIDVKAYGAKGDGVTNDSGAIQGAIDACPTNGCTIYFGSGSTYLISTGLNLGTTSVNLKQGIRLLGECGAPGQHDSGTCSHIVSSSGIVMLTAGIASSKLRGLVIQDLGFRDISAGTNVVTGAIQLINTEDFNLTNVHCGDILGPSTTTGFCFLFDGGDNFTQFGVVINPVVSIVKFPIQTKSQASEINVYGGNLACSSNSNAIGMDLGKTNPGTSTGGEWGVFGTHILNCNTGISMFNNSNMHYYGIMEQTGGKSGTTGIVIDGNTAGKPSKSMIAGSVNNFETGVLLDGQAVNNRILANISNTDKPIVIGVSAIAATLPSTLVLTTSNYAGTGGTAIGSQIPTDVTMPAEAKPPAPASGSRRLYVDSGSGNDFSVERSDGTAVDLEAASKLLNYQKATATIVGNGSNQTVYTFSIPSIPPGKGIRARVFWQCLVTCTQAKTFSWQLGTATAAYAAYSSTSMALAYAEVRVFNDPGSQTANTMFGDAITVGAALVSAGTVTLPAQDTSTAKSLTFLYNAASDSVTPKGFIVEVIQ